MRFFSKIHFWIIVFLGLCFLLFRIEKKKFHIMHENIFNENYSILKIQDSNYNMLKTKKIDNVVESIITNMGIKIEYSYLYLLIQNLFKNKNKNIYGIIIQNNQKKNKIFWKQKNSPISTEKIPAIKKIISGGNVDSENANFQNTKNFLFYDQYVFYKTYKKDNKNNIVFFTTKSIFEFQSLFLLLGSLFLLFLAFIILIIRLFSFWNFYGSRKLFSRFKKSLNDCERNIDIMNDNLNLKSNYEEEIFDNPQINSIKKQTFSSENKDIIKKLK